MTFFHFLNCMALTYAPFFLLYRSSELRTYSALFSCLSAALGYGATQAFKLFFLATFLSSDTEVFSFTHETAQMLGAIIDGFGVHLTLRYGKDLSKYPAGLRILAVGAGWTLAESVAHYLLPLWLGARGLEFSWVHTEMGLESNVNLLLNLGFIGCIWLFNRRDLVHPSSTVVVLALGGSIMLPTVRSYCDHVLGMSSAYLLGIRFLFALAIALTARLSLARYETARRVKRSK